ncbi:DNA damage response protein DdrC [Deinococcus detaillensis]|uniref:DNA damage response protein DdrC n=1 Tax=Deinococcus detaillensis TaxID=2592048 RepID=A0A553V0X7_9DEIO|nr:DNA damage response protein DdrC [Deinococcus detaillensis]TSA85841.1 DNA damage response protein DdrC [Deinococcus detaillensis]
MNATIDTALKTVAPTLSIGSARLPLSDAGRLHAASALSFLGLGQAAAWAQQDWESPHWKAFEQMHSLSHELSDFGAGPEPTLSVAEFVALAAQTQTTSARRLQRKMADTFARSLMGDIRLAAEVAERSSEPLARSWLHARLESQDARRTLMSAAAKHGGHGPIFGQLGSVSNRSVLGKDSATLRRERGVKQTRDGLGTDELRRLSYLDAATAAALEGGTVQGNDAILELHRKVAGRERQTWAGGLDRAG